MSVRIWLGSSGPDVNEHKTTLRRSLRQSADYQISQREGLDGDASRFVDDLRLEVMKRDAFLGVIGLVPSESPEDSNFSYAEIEYAAAVEADLPRLIWILSDERPVEPTTPASSAGLEKHRRFRRRLADNEDVTIFESVHDLVSGTMERIVLLVAPERADLAADDASRSPRAPDSSRYGRADSAAGAPQLELERGPAAHEVIEVFYGTNRQRTGLRRPNRFYGRRRATSVEVGRCLVSVPTDRPMGGLPRPRWWKLELRENPEKHVMVLSCEPLLSQDFHDQLASSASQGNGSEALVFIHGFKTSFADAIRRTAQLSHDLRFDGAAICFSWPTRGSIRGYPADEEAIDWSTPFLQKFLEDTLRLARPDKLHLIGHSMGNRALTEALERIGDRADASSAGTQVQEVILAAPDIDVGVFMNLATALATNADRVTLYASSNDSALAASRRFHLGQRAGDSGDGILVLRGIDTVDVSKVNTGLLAHSYYGANRLVVSDIFNLIKNGLPPDRRPGLVRQSEGEISYWMFVP